MTCRYSKDGPRTLKGRHDHTCVNDACTGCQPCTEDHCLICTVAHAATVCPECVAAARDDLGQIVDMWRRLPHRAVDAGGKPDATTPLVLHGPAAHWRAHASRMVRAMGQEGYEPTELDGDPEPVLFTLATWEDVYRDALDMPTDLRATVPRAADWLSLHLHRLAGMLEPPFSDFARDLRQCRGRLEDALHEGDRVERGAPCPECGRRLEHHYAEMVKDDRWRCPGRDCPVEYTERAYQAYREGRRLSTADRLTADEMHRQHGIRPGTLREWFRRGKVRKRGKDQQGRQLYDVRDALAAHQPIEESA